MNNSLNLFDQASGEVTARMAVLRPNPYFNSTGSSICSGVMELKFYKGETKLNVTNLVKPFTFTMTTNRPNVTVANWDRNNTAGHYGMRPICKFWDASLNKWSSEGCYAIN
ncbi:hypothetical protein AKO1_001322, partial [Acrasis kona]